MWFLYSFPTNALAKPQTNPNKYEVRVIELLEKEEDIHQAKLRRIARLQADRKAAERGEKVPGDPARNFVNISKEPIPLKE